MVWGGNWPQVFSHGHIWPSVETLYCPVEPVLFDSSSYVMQNIAFYVNINKREKFEKLNQEKKRE